MKKTGGDLTCTRLPRARVNGYLSVLVNVAHASADTGTITRRCGSFVSRTSTVSAIGAGPLALAAPCPFRHLP
jgi:hypothetical protein